jgi:plastocyanin
MKKYTLYSMSLVLFLALVLALIIGCSNSASTSKPTSTTATVPITTLPPTSTTATVPVTTLPPISTPATTAAPVTINLTAQNMAFDKTSISVQAGAKVTMTFDNKESLPHNFALYTDSSAATVIFKGEVITGPKTITYQFTAPSAAGQYFFRCDLHPSAMTGTFIVQ